MADVAHARTRHYLQEGRLLPQVHAGSVDGEIVGKQHPGNSDAQGMLSDNQRRTLLSSRRRRRSSVLILESESAQALQYQNALKARGYRVETASDGETAMRLAKEKRFDVVVSSIDGEQERDRRALMSIRNERKDLPVVLLSNGLAFSHARMAVECGAHRYLLKPVSVEHLVAVLAQTIHETGRLD